MIILIGMFFVFSLTGGSISLAEPNANAIPLVGEPATDPFNATYLIEGTAVRLTDGRHEVAAAPGSATLIKTSVFGKPVYGDMDGDGDEDVAVFLTHDSGGSGTFFYVAAALNLSGNYHGTNAVLIGDRIVPQSIRIRNGVVIANYYDRRPQEPMTVTPSIGMTKYLILDRNMLKEVALYADGGQVLEGWVTIGHEVRSFEPCFGKKALWLLGNSPALDEVMAAHRRALPSAMPYTPIFMTLAGRIERPPADGFGADYEGAFFATRLVQIFPQGNCKSDLIYMDSPLPGARVTSPLRIRGHARGKWFFEGDFPLVLTDSNGKVIAKGYATAKDAWMTEKFVPFEAVIEFKKPSSGSEGALILKKDNPTDLPEHDDELKIPVLFEL